MMQNDLRNSFDQTAYFRRHLNVIIYIEWDISHVMLSNIKCMNDNLCNELKFRVDEPPTRIKMHDDYKLAQYQNN